MKQGSRGLLLALFSCALLVNCHREKPSPSTPGTAPAALNANKPRDAGAANAPVADEPSAPVHLIRDGVFLGAQDYPRRLALATQPIAKIERGSGGRSLGFKITLADGTKGYYKPEQTFSAAHWYGEIAAYCLDRELGLGRAIPTVGRRFKWSTLRPYAVGDSRLDEIIVQRDGTVRGAFVWWVSAGLQPLHLGSGWERAIRLAGGFSPATTPFQRPINFAEAVGAKREAGAGGADTSGAGGAGAGAAASAVANAGNEPAAPATAEAAPAGATTENGAAHDPAAGAVVAAAQNSAGAHDNDDAQESHGITNLSEERASELSDMIVFDFLTNNQDRWSESYTNVRTVAGGPLVFLDNAAGFTPHGGISGLMKSRLRSVQRFRRSTIVAIRALNMRSFERRLNADPLAPVLDADQIGLLAHRRNELLDYVNEMEARFGERIYAW